MYKSFGISIDCYEKKITQIWLNGEEKEGMKEYKAELPYGLSFTILGKRRNQS